MVVSLVGRMKPGELQNGGYGFYYKGQQNVPQPQQDVLQNLQAVITPVETRPRPQEPAKPYKELITSKVYFTNEKWQECLSSHGIIIDPDKKTLTIQSTAAKQDFVYDLTDEELKKLTNNSVKEVPVETRLNLINNVIKNDFEDKITMDMLNSKEQIGIKLNPAVEQEMNQRQQVLEEAQVPIVMDGQQVTQEPEDRAVAHVDGQSLYEMNENKGWFREGRHGREVMVDDIKVEPVRNEQGEQQKDAKGNVLYRMTAVINSKAVSHDITAKQYDKFLALDDEHRMKLFAKVFPEVAIRNIPKEKDPNGLTFGEKLMAGLSAALGVAHEAGHIYRDVHGHRPDIYVSHVENHHEPREGREIRLGENSPVAVAARD